MNWKGPLEGAFLGFLSFGALSFVLSRSPLVSILSAFVGCLAHYLYGLLRPLPWKRYWLGNTRRACVMVHPHKLTFGEVSKGKPDRYGFIHIVDLAPKDLFEKLKGKRLDPATIPFHMRSTLEQRRELELGFDAISPYLIQES